MNARTLVLGWLVGVSVACVSTQGGGVAPAPESEAMALVAQAQERMTNGAITEALQLLRRAVALDPASDELAEEYAMALVAAGANVEAEAQLRRAKALTPQAAGVLGSLLLQHEEDPAAVEEAVRHLAAAAEADPDNLGVRYNLVQANLALGRGEAAFAALQPLLAERPGDPNVQLAAGKALRLARRWEEAASYFRQAAKFRSTQVAATLELVEAMAAAGKAQEAADVLGEFLQDHGATLEGLTRWASLLARAGNLAAAAKVADDVLSRDENYFDALWIRSLVAQQQGDLDLAEQMIRRAHAVKPEVLEATGALASLLASRGKVDEARALLETMWDHPKAVASAEHRERISQLLARLELDAGRLDAARVWLDRLPTQPLGVTTLVLWSRYFRLREAFAEGLAWLDAHPPGDGEAERQHRAYTADFLLALGEEARAREALQPLLSGGEDEVLVGIAVLQNRKRYEEAAAAARGAVERLPDSPAIRFELAASLERAGAWDEAVQEFRAVIAADPTHALALNYLGYMFADRGVNLEEARELLEEAVCLEPGSGAIQDSVGWVYFRLGDLGRAENHLLEASRLEPEDPTIYEHLGDLYRRLGNAELAAAAYRRALDLEPEGEEQRGRIEAALAELDGAPTP